MAWTIKLICGARTLDLGSGRYNVADNFAPPATSLVPLMAGGTSANRHGGAVKVGQSASNRDWSFTVNIINCASAAEVTRAIRDLAFFLSLAGDEAEPLYLYYKPDANIAATPTWGQSGVYYEIAHADVPQTSAGGNFQHLAGRASPAVTVTCQLKPYGRGQRQRLMSGTGGLLEFNWGAPDGQSKGLMVGGAYTNKMTNPILGHATFGNGWTTTQMIASQNLDPRFILFGRNSARLIATGTAASYTQSINVGNTNNHYGMAYVKKPDGSAVTTADVAIYYGSSQTTTVQPIGDGWYFVRGNFSGVAAGTAVGIRVLTDKEIYLGGFNLVETSMHPVHMVHGDMLGCSWSGTAHDSTSTRTAGRARLPTSGHLYASHGSLRLAVTPWISSGQTTAQDLYLFSCGATNMRALWQNSGGEARWIFIPAQNSSQANGALTTFVADTPLVFHFVWGDDAVTIYLNGASIATTASGITPTALGTDLYLGTTAAAGDHFPGVFHDLTAWDVSLTAAEVLADYNNVAPLVADSQRVSAIPWLWTKDGDDVVDNATDLTGSTGAPHDNFAIVAGVPGSAPAQTSIQGALSDTFANQGALWLSLLAHELFVPPNNNLVFDIVTDAGAVTDTGGAFLQTSVSTVATGIANLIDSASWLAEVLSGSEIYLLARVYDAGSTLNLGVVASVGNVTITTEYVSASANTTPKVFITKPVTLPARSRLAKPFGLTSGLNIFLMGKHTTGTANVRVDFVAILPRPLLKATASVSISSFALNSEEATGLLLSSSTVNATPLVLTGDQIEFEPGKYNTLISVIGNVAVNYTIALTLTYSRVEVTPRYALL